MSDVEKRIYVANSDKTAINENNLVNLTLSDGTVYERLEPRRLFPVNKLREYITLLDEEGKEIAVIRNISDLDEQSKEVIEYCLDYYYLVPHIIKIFSAVTKYGKLHWDVETDRGLKSFDILNRNHDIRAYKDGHVRVRDSDDNRYIITDYRKLDKHSQKQLITDI